MLMALHRLVSPRSLHGISCRGPPRARPSPPAALIDAPFRPSPRAQVRLDLRACVRLLEVPDAVARMPKLESLQLGGCVALRSLPDELGLLPRLAELHLDGCQRLPELPSTLPSCLTLRELSLEGCTAVRAVPDLSHLGSTLQLLNLRRCHSLHPVPGWVDRLLTDPTGKFCKVFLPQSGPKKL